MAVSKNTIKVVVDISKGLATQAKGTPANIVACFAGAAIVLIAGGLAAGAYEGAKGLAGVIRRKLPDRSPS